MSNRLASESSPYLLQHADNPVDWWPWCSEAFEIARKKDKPVFLSVGYSACHWCHVMEHESFENESIAKFLNKHFVSIKVDREERPDVDHIYMQAVMAMTGHGGWPLSAFLTADQQFFFGGTYWPPEKSRGMPGFDHVLQSVVDAYKNKRETIDQQSAQVTQMLRQNSMIAAVEANQLDGLVTLKTISKAIDGLQKSFDVVDGGFGSAPKFPHPMDLNLLIRAMDYADQLQGHSRASIKQMFEVTLNKMAYGGIYDHLGGGFARYSVDSKWLVPHFEKMLYDNGQLANVYLNAHRATDDPFFRRVAEETLDYILNYLLDENGGFHSTEDADSEGVEGKFYVWSKSEILNILGDELGTRFCKLYDVTESGNFEGANILNVKVPYGEFAEANNIETSQLCDEMDVAREKLLAVRDQRVRPGKDDKILVSWAALAIDAFANAAELLNSEKYLVAAQNAAKFLLNQLRRDDGRLLHSWRHGEAKLDGYLDDYSYLINALISLYAADQDDQWIDHAVELAQIMIEHFGDEGGGFFFTANDHEELIVRTRDLQDSSVPSGNSMAAYSLIRLGRLCSNDLWIGLGQETIKSAAALIERAPMATGQMLLALDLLLRPNKQNVLVLENSSPGENEEIQMLVEEVRQHMEHGTSLVVKYEDQDGSEHLRSILSGKRAIDRQPTLYVCENYACQSPLVGVNSILESYKPEVIGEIT